MSLSEKPSNTLVVSGLRRDCFLSLVAQLQAAVSFPGSGLAHWAPLKSFGRVVAVFTSAQNALRAKMTLLSHISTLAPAERDIYVYFSQHTDLHETSKLLQPPDAARMWLISPPPSPPASWKSQREPEPNRQAHLGELGEALALALANLPQNKDVHGDHSDAGKSQRPQPMVRRFTLQESELYAAEPVTPLQRAQTLTTPSIVLETEVEDGELSRDCGSRLRGLRTEMPPVLSM